MHRVLTCVCILLSLTAWAEVPKAEVSKVSVEIIELYDTLRELSLEEQRKQTWALPSDTKAALWRYNLELYLHEHPQLGPE